MFKNGVNNIIKTIRYNDNVRPCIRIKIVKIIIPLINYYMTAYMKTMGIPGEGEGGW